MKKINFKGLGEFQMPEKWSELTIDKFIQVCDLQKAEDKTKADDQMENFIKVIKITSILSGIPFENLTELDIPDNNKLAEVTSFINTQIEDKPVTTFVLDGVEYGFVQKLSRMNTAEFIDFDTYIKDEHFIRNLHKIAALLYRPIVKKTSETEYELERYDFYSTEKRSELFLTKLSVDKVYGGMVFLLALGLIYSEHILSFLSNQMKESQEKNWYQRILTKFKAHKKASKNIGVGTSLYIK